MWKVTENPFVGLCNISALEKNDGHLSNLSQYIKRKKIAAGRKDRQLQTSIPHERKLRLQDGRVVIIYMYLANDIIFMKYVSSSQLNMNHLMRNAKNVSYNCINSPM